MPLTDVEKVAIRDHLGFPNVSSVATFALGAPAATQTAFIIERAMDLLPEVALPRVRMILTVLEQIDAQRIGDMELAAVNQIGDIGVNQQEQEQLNKRHRYWCGRMCNAMAVFPNPFDQAETATGGFGSVRVR